MESETEWVFRYIVRTGGLEEEVAAALDSARSHRLSLSNTVRDYVVGDITRASGVNQQDLATMVDWDAIVQKLEYRQSLNEMAYR